MSITYEVGCVWVGEIPEDQQRNDPRTLRCVWGTRQILYTVNVTISKKGGMWDYPPGGMAGGSK